MNKKPNLWERTLVFYDLETTGLNPFLGHEILEIGAVKGGPQSLEIIKEFEVKVLPEHLEKASPESFQYNHYEAEVWEKEAIPLKEAMGQFAKFSEGSALFAQNHTFDWSFVQEATTRCGIDLEKDFGVDYHRLDLPSISYFLLAPFYEDERVEGVSLRKIASYLGIPHMEEHRALSDARATYEVYRAWMEWYRDLVSILEVKHPGRF